MKTEGLTIKNGRLVNNRPNQMTGIQEASMYRQMMKKQYKIDCIADGIERAEMRKGLRLIWETLNVIDDRREGDASLFSFSVDF